MAQSQDAPAQSAVPPESRVILIEQIIEEGSGFAMNKWMDLLMLVLVGGQERTVPEYRRLLEKAGFEIQRIIRSAGPFSLVVGRPHE
jgi:C-methyltransferase